MYKKANDWAKWVAVDSDGREWEHETKPIMWRYGWYSHVGLSLVSTNNNATNWQNSLIEIDTQEYKHEFVNDWAVAFVVTSEGVGVELSAAPKRDDENSSGWSGGYYGDYTMFYVDHNYQGDWKDSLQLREEPKQEPTAWNGEGLPPVGTACEVMHNNEWQSTFIIGKDKIGNTVYDCYNINCDYDSRYSAYSCPSMFRPIKTEREKVIEKALEVSDGSSSNYEAIKMLCNANMLKLPEGEL